jgi:outer membrane protein OmpA-like peptidoglycan-associated protein
LSITIDKSLLDNAINALGGGSSGALPKDIARLDQTPLNFGDGWVNATARLKPNEVGRVSHVVFMIRNADGTTARTVRVKVPSTAGRVSTQLPRLVNGQRIVTFVENNFGLSPNAPKRRNVVQGPTSRGRDAAGNPILLGDALLVDRIIFDATSPALDARDKAQLDRVARELRGRAGVLLISGFARQNLIDGSKFLKNLSVERARNVANYLSTNGVRAWIRFDGFGAVTSEPGTAADRRVEIRWSSGGREALIQK